MWERGQHLRAGADYLAALQKLGLNPECLFWADDEVVGHSVLVLVTHHFDRVGPLALSDLLFRAYDAAATPREINPFVLRLHSPEQAIVRELAKVFALNVRAQNADGSKADFAKVYINAGGLKFDRDWIYRWDLSEREPSRMVMARQWRRFANNVNRLAA